MVMIYSMNHELFYGILELLYFSPVCFKMIEEPYMTKCGHSFW